MTLSAARYWLAEQLRFLADRVHRPSAFKATSLRFHFETGAGCVVTDSGNVISTEDGCPLWYRGDADYEKAHEVSASLHSPFVAGRGLGH